MDTVSRLAPAKVNLWLRIIGRRGDGYHLLDSLMVPINLYDTLTIRCSEPPREGTVSRITVDADSAAVPTDESNLAYRAAELFLHASARSLHVHIHIAKRIPPGSGLGGGSSDAATVLRVLNKRLGSPYSTAELATLGARIGADVPFFIYSRPARVGGIGDRIAPVDTCVPFPMVVCSDGYALSTKLVYSRVDLSLTTGCPASNIIDRVIDYDSITNLLVNDLEGSAAQIHPEVLSLKEQLLAEGARGALMTGSGSAVFGVFADVREAERAANVLRAQGLWAAAVHTLDGSQPEES